MAGLIWFVQCVHYPLFSFAAGSDFPWFAAEHQRRTSLVVAPLMLVELASGVLLLMRPPAGVEQGWLWLGLGLLGLIWASTVLAQIPMHARLSRAWDPDALRRLVTGNWVRTAGWSARAVLALSLVAWGRP